MLGFGQKKKSIMPEPEAQGRVQTIPDVFYGGNDPDVYRRASGANSSEASVKVIAQAPKPVANTPAVTQANHRGLVFGVVGVLFVAAVGGIAWYYTAGLRNQPVVSLTPSTTVTTIVTNTLVEVIDIPVVTTTIETVSSTIAAPTSTLIAGGPLEFAPLNPLDTIDFDRDLLTDAEEEIFGTDPASWDTEKDGYYDGQEVFNLYNPIGMAPVRLIDSGTVLEYANPVFGYSLYYPKGWTVATVDTENRQVVITAPNGDYIEVRALAKTTGEDFNTWFARTIKDQNVTDLLQATNRFEVQGWKRRDDLVAYFMGANDGFVVLFHPLSSGPVAYRHIMQMVAQSFRSGRINATLPDQPILPGTAPLVTSTVDTVISTSTP